MIYKSRLRAHRPPAQNLPQKCENDKASPASSSSSDSSSESSDVELIEMVGLSDFQIKSDNKEAESKSAINPEQPRADEQCSASP
jgi:hypothetical protein